MKNIYNWRELVGRAATVEGAKRVLKRKLSLSDKATLHVWERSPEICEMNDLAPGFTYSVSWGSK